MSEITVKGFTEFVKSQPDERTIDNSRFWRDCAVGAYIREGVEMDVDRGSDIMSILLCKELTTADYHIIGNASTSPTTYGALKVFLKESLTPETQ